ncbi:MAG: xanthine dehydrogenase family protein molybdopterin-binding subunit, partial [Candidatus Rokuibacteriota bacterium]
PHAHARIRAIDVAAARARPGVADVVTFADVPELARPIPMRMSDRGRMHRYLQHPLARGKVRYVGEPVVAIVAENRYVAEDALDHVTVGYEPLPALVDGRAASEPGAPLLFEEEATNVVATYTIACGDVDGALRQADVVLREVLDVQRHTAVPMETRGAVAEYDAGRRVLSMWGMTKVPHWNRGVIAEHVGLPEHCVHFLQMDVGGAFGVRGELYPEDFLVALLALRTGRPVRWIEDRREHLMAANHSREQRHEIAVALRRDGTILGIHDRFWNNMGAYVRTHGATAPNNTAGYLPGPYRIPHYRAEVTCVVTNKTPAGTYRAPGRFEASFVRERVVDMAARALGLDPAEIRRRNFIPPEAMPYEVGTTTLGRKIVYDSGDFPRLFAWALDRAGYGKLREEQARARQAGRHLGIGLAYVVEKSGLGPWETARVLIDRSGRVVVATGVPSVGQGVETIFAQVCADVLGVRYEDVTVRWGDTDLLPDGFGAFASRGTVMGANAVVQAAERVRDKVLAVAARDLEAHPDDLELREGVVRVRGVPDRALTLREVARAAMPTPALAAGLEPGLEALEYYQQEKMTYGHGLHLAVVEVDGETGVPKILRYVVAYDVGRSINPMLVEGQIVGGLAQGLGAALHEELSYDQDGQLLTGTLMEYHIPAAADLPPLEVWIREEDRSPVNPLGVKGAGEDGIVAAGAAVANAVADALAPLGVEITALPVRPARVRELIRAAGTNTAAALGPAAVTSAAAAGGRADRAGRRRGS